MAYRFKLNESFDTGLRRIGLEQLERALGELRRSEAGTAIHETRKSIKRLRALLRLVRAGIDDDVFRTLNVALRDAGRAMSATRDRDVLIKTMAVVSGEAPALRPVLRRLVKDLSAGNGNAYVPADTMTQARATLQRVRSDWQALALSPDNFAPIAEGIERGAEVLTEALAASEDGDDEAFHDLRKAVQRHWRQMRLVCEGWPAHFEARAGEAKAISELLGAAQDLTLLHGHIEAQLTVSEVKVLQRHVIERRAALRETARERCARLVAEAPRAQAKRAALYWASAARIAAETPEPDKPKVSRSRPAAQVRQAAVRAARPPRKRSPGPKPGTKAKPRGGSPAGKRRR